MISRLLPLLLTIATALPGAADDARLRLGEEALAAGLWEIAAGHFEAHLTSSPDLAPEDKAAVAIRLAESLLRDDRASEALALLDESFAASHPAAPFWRGQSLAALGRLAESVETLMPLLKQPQAQFHSEAVFTIANVQLALGKNNRALKALDALATSGDPALAARAKLRKVEILLDLDRVPEARETMPAMAGASSEDRPLHAFLEGRLLMAEGKPAEAASFFRSLIDLPQGQSLRRHHQAAVGLCDALLASGRRDAVLTFIPSFLQSHPDSPELDALFQRLREAMPENAASSDPAMELLSQWIPPSEPPAAGLIAMANSHAAAAWPTPTTAGEITAHALFTRALMLRRSSAPDAAVEIRRLFNRLRVEFPAHPLAGRALYELASMELAAGQRTRALEILENLRETAADPQLRGRAAFLAATTTVADGDKPQAASLFGQAAEWLDEKQAHAARFNAAILILAENDAASPATTVEPALAADIQLERALSLDEDAARIAAIEEFLIAHPDHPRVPEARLALAEAALGANPPDLSLARAQLDTLAAGPESRAGIAPLRAAMVRLRIADIDGQPEVAIATAREILEQFPGQPAAAEAALVLGRNLYQTGAYNDARMVLERLATTDTDPACTEAAWLLAARSAALVPASQSQQEALILFRKVIDAGGTLAPIATMETARLMIDMNRLDEAAAFLRGWFDSLEKSDPMRLPAGLLLGEAIYAQGSAKPDSLAQALAVYDSLLADAEPHSALHNRLQYLRGRTLEQLPQQENPSRTREREAFAAYYSVLETDTPPADWHYFELCGFRALALLEKAGRWPAAIACARKIASFNGPRAQEASQRASQLQLRHMIWED
jgi:tetratricopeptide (TPR) repeat protein